MFNRSYKLWNNDIENTLFPELLGIRTTGVCFKFEGMQSTDLSDFFFCGVLINLMSENKRGNVYFQST